MLLLLQTHKLKVFMMTLPICWCCGLFEVFLHFLYSAMRTPGEAGQVLMSRIMASCPCYRAGEWWVSVSFSFLLPRAFQVSVWGGHLWMPHVGQSDIAHLTV